MDPRGLHQSSKPGFCQAMAEAGPCPQVENLSLMKPAKIMNTGAETSRIGFWGVYTIMITRSPKIVVGCNWQS